MPLDTNPQEMPPEDRVAFEIVVDIRPKAPLTYKVYVDGKAVGHMTQLMKTLWRIDSVRNSYVVTGVGNDEDEAKRFWWRNWKLYDDLLSLKLTISLRNAQEQND